MCSSSEARITHGPGFVVSVARHGISLENHSFLARRIGLSGGLGCLQSLPYIFSQKYLRICVEVRVEI